MIVHGRLTMGNLLRNGMVGAGPQQWVGQPLLKAKPIQLALAVLLQVGMMGMGHAHAAEWPTRPIQVVNPYPAGSTTDVLARALSEGLSAELGQPAVVVNRDGAAGSVGIAAVARSAPDGYTIAFSPTTPLVVTPLMRGDTGYSASSLIPICQAYEHAMAVVVRPSSPLRSLADLVVAAKQGATLQYGHLGNGSTQHLAAAALAQAAGIELEPVVYRGDGAVLLDVMAGRLDFGVVVVGSVPNQPVRPIALFANERSRAFPDVPTVREAGFDVVVTSYGGLLAPAGTPPDVVDRLEAACAGAAAGAAYVAAARTTLQPDHYHLSRAAFAAKLQQDLAQKRTLLSAVGELRRD